MVSSVQDAVDIDTKPILNKSENDIVSGVYQIAERNSYNIAMQSSTLWQDSNPINDGLDNLKEFLVLDDINQDSDKESENDLDSDYESTGNLYLFHLFCSNKMMNVLKQWEMYVYFIG